MIFPYDGILFNILKYGTTDIRDNLVKFENLPLIQRNQIKNTIYYMLHLYSNSRKDNFIHTADK